MDEFEKSERNLVANVANVVGGTRTIERVDEKQQRSLLERRLAKWSCRLPRGTLLYCRISVRLLILSKFSFSMDFHREECKESFSFWQYFPVFLCYYVRSMCSCEDTWDVPGKESNDSQIIIRFVRTKYRTSDKPKFSNDWEKEKKKIWILARPARSTRSVRTI